MTILKFVLFVISSGLSSPNEISDHLSEPRRVVDELKTIRTKRIVWGEPLMDMKSYDVTHYLVHITGGICASTKMGFYLWNLGVCEPPSVGQIKCGGALIKEYVIQTACHCIAFFSAINDTHTKTTPRDVWEHTFAMYVGYFDVTKMMEGSRPTLFLQHQKCRKYVEAGIIYDFGIIVARVPLIKQHFYIREAPVYPISELQRLYQAIQREQRVCLIAGWGVYRFITTGDGGEYKVEVPRFLQHSWVRVMNYRECYRWHGMLRSFLKRFGELFDLTYHDLAKWFCGRHFGKFRGAAGSGDSGSPVTCDSEYLGIASSGPDYMREKKRLYKDIAATQAAIRFTEQSNAAEFRRSFLTEVHTILWRHLLGLKKKAGDRDLDNIPRTYLYMHSGSRCCVADFRLQLILISNILFFKLYPVGAVK